MITFRGLLLGRWCVVQPERSGRCLAGPFCRAHQLPRGRHGPRDWARHGRRRHPQLCHVSAHVPRFPRCPTALSLAASRPRATHWRVAATPLSPSGTRRLRRTRAWAATTWPGAGRASTKWWVAAALLTAARTSGFRPSPHAGKRGVPRWLTGPEHVLCRPHSTWRSPPLLTAHVSQGRLKISLAQTFLKHEVDLLLVDADALVRSTWRHAMHPSAGWA